MQNFHHYFLCQRNPRWLNLEKFHRAMELWIKLQTDSSLNKRRNTVKYSLTLLVVSESTYVQLGHADVIYVLSVPVGWRWQPILYWSVVGHGRQEIERLSRRWMAILWEVNGIPYLASSVPCTVFFRSRCFPLWFLATGRRQVILSTPCTSELRLRLMLCSTTTNLGLFLWK
jgi:hypothetical protein